MDVQRKRQVRLFVALGAALLLATGLIYTSFNASSEARQPSELTDAVPGKSYEMTGKVVKGSVVEGNDRLKFSVKDRDGTGQALPVTYSGVVPDPFREGREIVLTGTVQNGVFVGE
ncbi:MAG: cytochrome c maturation protein CcmE, partial [Solirubrobacterales bacterium]|nr:cytochrome c maturation protein CcmE [Solirubrobacterales bacterium]